MTIWHHICKGRIVGTITRTDDTWTHVLLTEDAWADVRHRRVDHAGTIATYRTEFLSEVVA